MEYAIGAAGGLVLGFVAAAAFLSSRDAVGKRAKSDAAFAAKLQAILAGADIKPVEPPKPPKPSGAALRMLVLLQEGDGRIVDFLMEDLTNATPDQVVSATMKFHKAAGEALRRYAILEPILPGDTDDSVIVPKGFDPSVIRVIGNIVGEPPFSGKIEHPGWRVKELKVQPPPEGADEFVLQPAVVQV